MDVNSQFLDFISKQNLVRKATLGELGNSVAVDANSWFASLLDPEPKTKAVGLNPIKAAKRIKELLDPLRDAGIRVTLVFEGISLSLKEKSSAMRLADNGRKLSLMWEKYSVSQADSTLSELNKSDFNAEDFVTEVVFRLRQDGFDCIRAPYQQQAQCASLEAKGHVTAVLGKADLFIYEVQKVVLSFDATHFSYISSSEMQKRLGITLPHLRVAFIQSGYWFNIENEKLSKMLSVFKPTQNPQAVNALELIKAAPRLELDRPNRLKMSRASNLALYLGRRLPDSLYSAILLSFVSTKVFGALCSGEMVEMAPLADSNYYRRCLANVEAYRYRSLRLVAEELPPIFNETPVNIVYWHKETSPRRLRGTFSKLNWTFNNAELTQELKRQAKQLPDLQFALKWHYDSYGADWSLVSSFKREEAKTTTTEEALARAMLRFVQQIDLINAEGKPMFFGRLMLQSSGEFQHSTLLLLELFRQGLLNGHTIPQHKSNPISAVKFEALVAYQPSVSENSRYIINLLARVAMLVPATLSTREEWQGPVDYSLLQFYCIVRMISKSFRSLLECEVVSQFLSGKLPPAQLIDVVPQLPLSKQTGLVLGLLVKHIMLMEQDSVDDLQTQFPQLTEIDRDLRRTWEFWGIVMNIVRTMRKYNVLNDSSFALFNEANAAFKLRLIRLGLS